MLKGLTLAMLAYVACIAPALISADEINTQVTNNETEEYTDQNVPVDGMFFSSEYVVESYEYDDANCILYDDCDANLSDCEIKLDAVSYNIITESVENGQKLCGILVLCEGSEDVYTFQYDPINLMY